MKHEGVQWARWPLFSTDIGSMTVGRKNARDFAAEHVVAIGFGVYLVAKALFLLVLSVNTQYLMDEFMVEQSTRFIDQNPYQDSLPGRTLFSAYFYRISFWIGSNSVEIMRIARIETVIIALASLILLYAVAREIGRTRYEALFAVCVTLAFSSYMEWAFAVRPEPLALLFAIAAVWAGVREPATFRTYLLAGLLSGAAFLTTQKSVYFNFALGTALVTEALIHKSPLRALRSGAILLLGWGIMIALYVGFFALDGADPGTVVQLIFLGPTTANAISGHEVYVSLRQFTAHTFIRNALVYMICVIGWLAAVATIHRRPSGERVAMIFTAVIAGLVFGYHPAPWPYNFVMAIPFLALWSPLLIEPIRRMSRLWQTAAYAVALLIVGASFARNLHYLGHDNAVQERTMAQVESLLGPDEAYFDGIFMVAARPHPYNGWLDRNALQRIIVAAAAGNLNAIENILANATKLWILSYRTKAIEDILHPFLDDSYVAVAPNILLSGMRLEGLVERVFNNRWPGTYRLYDGEGRPSDATFIFDGVPVNGRVTLQGRAHRLRMASGDVVAHYLLPDDFQPVGPIASEFEQIALFPSAHTF